VGERNRKDVVSRRGLAGAATLCASVALVLYVGVRVAGYLEGAAPGFSGGFGEPSCEACHFGGKDSAGPGRLTIAGVADRFAPGERYPLTITLTRPDMKLAGFQLTARFKDGGAQAGSFAPVAGEEERFRIEAQAGVQYVNQRQKGASLSSDDTATWTLMWTAPPAKGTVVFHVAANAADGDETAEGDHVHTLALETVPGPPAPR
jgi:hypothetical protein